jgi:hypothetical protein
VEYYYDKVESMCSVHGELRNAYKIVIINMEGTSRDLDINGRTMLKYGVRIRTKLI